MQTPRSLAGLALAGSTGWAITGRLIADSNARGRIRNRLSERDAALVAAEVGPRFPATSTLAQYLAAWERAVDVAPDQADRWYELGDTYFHEGFYLQIPSTRHRAAEAFRRSLAIDSNTAALGHLSRAAVLDGDTTEVRRLGPVYLAHDSSGELRDFYRWRIAEGVGDARAPAALRAEYAKMPLQSLWRIMGHAVLDGSHLDDADAAAQAIRASAGRGSDWQRSKTYLHAFENNRGRASAAVGDTARRGETEYGPHTAMYERVLDALYGDGDVVSADAASRELAGVARAGADSVAQTDLCVSTLWGTNRGVFAGVSDAVARLPAHREIHRRRERRAACVRRCSRRKSPSRRARPTRACWLIVSIHSCAMDREDSATARLWRSRLALRTSARR